MQIILLFDEKSLNGTVRTFTLERNFARCLDEGADMEITFCHPKFGEKFIAKPIALPTIGPDEDDVGSP